MGRKWFVRQQGFTDGPLVFRDLISELVALEDWRGAQVKHGEMNNWFPASHLEFRAARSERHTRWRVSLILLIVGMTFGMALTILLTQPVATHLREMADPDLRQRSIIAGKLMKARQSLPKKIDQHALRTDISYTDPVLTFSNILLFQSANLPESARADIIRSVTENTCSFAQARQFMAAGGTIVFDYADIDAQPLSSILVAEQSCF